MTARSSPSPFRRTARRSPPAAISAPGIGDKPPYGDVRLFDFATGKVKAVLKAPDYAIYDLAFSPDGNSLAAGGGGWLRLSLAARRADGHRLEAAAQSSMPIPGTSNKLAFADGGKQAGRRHHRQRHPALGHADGRGDRDAPTPNRCATQPVMALAVSPDGALFATGNNDGLVQLWKAADGTLVRAMPKQDFLDRLADLRRGSARLVASCGYRCADKHRTVVWTVADGEQVLRVSRP